MPTKREKQAAFEKMTPRESQLFNAVKGAGASGIGFKPLKEKLQVNSPNMLYGRIAKLKASGLLRTEQDGRVATYFADYEP